MFEDARRDAEYEIANSENQRKEAKKAQRFLIGIQKSKGIMSGLHKLNLGRCGAASQAAGSVFRGPLPKTRADAAFSRIRQGLENLSNTRAAQTRVFEDFCFYNS